MPKYNDFAYIIKIDNTVEIIKYLGNDKHVNIPSEIDEYPVTRIGGDAFSGCDSLTSITIPDSVTRIGISAFSGCTSLSNIIIPDSVTSISVSAFSDCTSLTSVTILNSVTSIGEWAFKGCTSLQNIKIKGDVLDLRTRIFDGCDSLTITCPKNSDIEKWARENGYTVNSIGSKLSNFLSRDDNLNGGVCHAEI